MTQIASMTSNETVEALCREMAESWHSGERIAAEAYLARIPESLENTEDAVRLVYEEICLRQEVGEEVDASDLAARFPQWAEELAVLLDCHRLLHSYSAHPQFPSVGETLGDFRLVAELGRGVQGRIFLARQQTLSDRPVVLKVTPRRAHEHLSLARLQHTHIIPLHAIYEFPGRNLRAMCLPYLGGATLDRILQYLQKQPGHLRTGLSIVEALDAIQSEFPIKIPLQERFRSILARGSYVDALCMIGACLADGLQYAHERHLIHLDIKPSNVLLSADAQPLLLDFHLAVRPLQAGQAPPEWFGGTQDYLSPEHDQAIRAARTGKAIPAAVDRRSDIYSLGKLLYVALAGETVSAPTLASKEDHPESHVEELPPSPLRTIHPHISVGLSDIIQKCLAAAPDERYQDAATLATDLRRQLASLPLLGVRNRSLREQWRKWRKRSPHAPLVIGLLLAVLVSAAILSSFVLDRWHEAREALAQGQDQLTRHVYRDAVNTFSKANERINTLPGFNGLKKSIADNLHLAQCAMAAKDLHDVADNLRFLAGGEKHSEKNRNDLDGQCRQVWEKRALLANADGNLAKLDSELQTRTDLIDLGVIWSDLRRQLKQRQSSPASLDEENQIFAEVERLIGGSNVVKRQRALLHGRSGLPVNLDKESSQNAWEYVLLGRSLLRQDRLEQAAGELEKAIELRPQDFWAHFYQGACAYRRKLYPQAAQSFSVAIALIPDSAECYYNRGLAYAGAGSTAAALHDYNRALALKPALGAAALNRGSLYYQEKRYPDAIADLEYALAHGADPVAAHYNLALVYLATKKEGLAQRELELALQADPAHQECKSLLAKLRH